MHKFAIRTIVTVLGILASMSSAASFILNDNTNSNSSGSIPNQFSGGNSRFSGPQADSNSDNAIINRRNVNNSTVNNNNNDNNNNNNNNSNRNDPFALYDPFKDTSIIPTTNSSNSNGLSQLIDPFRSMTTNLKVATFNVWGLVTSKDRVPRVEAIARYFTKNPRGIDVLCLQEVWMSDDYRTIRAALSLEFPHAHYFKSGVVGSGLAVFSKYPIKDAWWKGFTLTGKAHRIFDGDWYAGKGIGAVRINHPVIGDVDVFNTHLIANYSPTDYDADWYKAHRATQLYELIRHVDRTSSPTAYTIVMGDLNTQPVEDSYKSMLRKHELYTSYQKPLRNVWRDIAKERRKRQKSKEDFVEFGATSNTLTQTDPDQWNSTTMLMSHENGKHFTCNLRSNSYYNPTMPEQQIDHIMYIPDGRIRCVDAGVFLTHPTRDASGQPGPSYSDHAALMATFEIKPSDQVILNGLSKSPDKSKLVADASTQKLMIRLNEDVQGLSNQKWSYRVWAVICFILGIGLCIAAVFLMRKANDPSELQKFLSVANAPDKYKWYEKISLNWYAFICLILTVPIALYCQGLIWNAIVFFPQEMFAFKEFQYEWALWLREH